MTAEQQEKRRGAPEGPGHEQRDATIASIPVIVLTAGTRNVKRLEAMNVAAYMTKNVDIETLLETVHRLVGSDRAAS